MLYLQYISIKLSKYGYNMKKLIKLLVLKLVNLIKKLLPKNRFGDKIYALIDFLKAHRRFPKKQLIFNDVLYNIRASDEIVRPEICFTTDKEFVKLYIKSKVGDAFNIPTITILKTKEEVLNFKFPKRCVIKPTHSSGRVVLRKNGENLNLNEITNWLSENYYDEYREANYKYLKPKIIVEEFVFDQDDVDDIKFFCYQGKVKVIQWDFDRHTNHTRKLYDINWNDLQLAQAKPLSQKNKEKPKNLSEMIVAAEILSSDFDFVRIDLFTNGSSFYCGEITHCSDGANGRFDTARNEIQISKIIFGD